MMKMPRYKKNYFFSTGGAIYLKLQTMTVNSNNHSFKVPIMYVWEEICYHFYIEKHKFQHIFDNIPYACEYKALLYYKTLPR